MYSKPFKNQVLNQTPKANQQNGAVLLKASILIVHYLAFISAEKHR